MTAPDFQSYPPKILEERLRILEEPTSGATTMASATVSLRQDEPTRTTTPISESSSSEDIDIDADGDTDVGINNNGRNRNSNQQQQQHDDKPGSNSNPNRSSKDDSLSEEDDSSSVSSSSSVMMLSKAQQRLYTKNNLEAFNLLDIPVWVFDIVNKAMWWANDPACYLWDAPDCESLCKRDFAVGMSKANEHTLNAWLEQFRLGESNERTWTFHPNGGKDGPKTCQVKLSGIYVGNNSEDRHFCMLVVCKKVIDGKSRDEEDAQTIRRTEMLRHFPIVARQFNCEGKLMDQNPEALKTFGSPADCAPSDTIAPTKATPTASTSRKRLSNISIKSNTSHDKETTTVYSASGIAPTAKTTNASTSKSKLGKEISSSTPPPPPPSSSPPPPPSSPPPPPPSPPKDCAFLSQFVDKDEGWEIFKKTVAEEGVDYSTETQQMTLEGPKWFTVNVRSVRDPVTSERVIIYSARDITQVMESAKIEADKQNLARSEFFAVMAHEIRTPLHQVVGFIELLASSGLNAEQTESVDMLQSSAHALMAIINDLLDFTKLEAGKMKLEIIPFEVRGVLNGSVAAVQPQVHEKGLVVKCNVDPKIPIKLLGDPNRLRQIVLNMLSNAVKFTKRGEIVVQSNHIKKEDGREWVRFSVKDSGIGIPKDKCDRIFNPYQQADASVSRNYGGTGLGLAICKSLVENMGGTIGVDSELGKGATFWFEIPLGIYVKGNQQDPSELDAKSNHTVANLRILVAEDNKVNQKVVCKMLSRLGHEAVVAENGQEAVDKIIENENHGFDIVLMDWQMPVMDGIDATKEIRRKGFSVDDLPIIGLTASIQGLDWSAIGMNDCLKKPIRIADLKACLKKNMI